MGMKIQIFKLSILSRLDCNLFLFSCLPSESIKLKFTLIRPIDPLNSFFLKRFQIYKDQKYRQHLEWQ